MTDILPCDGPGVIDVSDEAPGAAVTADGAAGSVAGQSQVHVRYSRSIRGERQVSKVAGSWGPRADRACPRSPAVPARVDMAVMPSPVIPAARMGGYTQNAVTAADGSQPRVSWRMSRSVSDSDDAADAEFARNAEYFCVACAADSDSEGRKSFIMGVSGPTTFSLPRAPRSASRREEHDFQLSVVLVGDVAAYADSWDPLRMRSCRERYSRTRGATAPGLDSDPYRWPLLREVNVFPSPAAR
jgi:hypothetical protein